MSEIWKNVKEREGNIEKCEREEGKMSDILIRIFWFQ
jgi:hypothetical protein